MIKIRRGLFDTANMPHTSDSMYDMSLIREGIIVDSVEGENNCEFYSKYY